jgi:TonB family protein
MRTGVTTMLMMSGLSSTGLGEVVHFSVGGDTGVDVQPATNDAMRIVAYPPLLHSAKVEGDVLAQFVVDTLGRPDMETFHVLKSTHELFTSAVQDVLPRCSFRPAQLGGKAVRQLVQMPFQFRITP